MGIAISPDATEPFTPPSERQLPKDEQTIYELASLTWVAQQKLDEMSARAEGIDAESLSDGELKGDLAFQMKTGDERISKLRFCLRDIRNLQYMRQRPDGEEELADVKLKMKAEILLGTKGKWPTLDSIAFIPPAHADAILDVIDRRNRVSVEEAKN